MFYQIARGVSANFSFLLRTDWRSVARHRLGPRGYPLGEPIFVPRAGRSPRPRQQKRNVQLNASAGGVLAETEEYRQSGARWPTVPLLLGEKVHLAGMPAPLSDGVMAASEVALAYAAGLAEAFDILGLAAVMLDKHGRVISANRAAKATLTTDLRIARGRLTASNRETSKTIVKLVDQVTSACEGPALRSPVVVPRSARRPLVVYAIQLGGEPQDRFSPARALLVILDLDARPALAEAHVQQIFGLTSAESRLVVQLARGVALKTAANVLKVAKETARTQLKAVFAKTGTSRQTELIALIGRLLPDHPGGPGRLR